MGWNVSGADNFNPGTAKDRDYWAIRGIGKSEISTASEAPQPGNSSPAVDDQSLSCIDVHDEGSLF